MILVLDPLEILGIVLLVFSLGVALVMFNRTPPPAQSHPGCVTCGAFATYAIAGQPLCEDHARSAHKAGYQPEPIR